MPEKKSSETSAKKKTAAKAPAAKKRAPRKQTAKPAADATPVTAQSPRPPGADRLSEVARSIGSTVGAIAAKTKRVLRRKK